jgi:hypothetical protein
VVKATKIGIAVTCTRCGGTKQPHGRSVPLGHFGCNNDCRGYAHEPLPGCLWPGETDADFGYDSCDNATKPVEADRG